jgi:hypothetical protein
MLGRRLGSPLPWSLLGKQWPNSHLKTQSLGANSGHSGQGVG